MRFLDCLTVMSTALLIGNELSVWVFINPVLWKLEERSQAKATSLFAARLGKAMPFWYALSLLLLLLEAVLHRRDPGGPLLIASCTIWASVVILTLIFLVPINNRLAKMDTNTMTQRARREHKKWDELHRWRVVALGASLIFLLAGVGL